MASQIINIYNALDAVSVTVKGKTPKVYDLEELPESIHTAQLPCRLLLPVGNDNAGEGRDGEFIAIGTGITVNWTVKDLMLWKPSEQGRGLSDFAPVLVEYCGLYADAMRSFKCPYANSALESFSMMPGMYEYPVGSGNWYAGVMCYLQIKEVISG